MSSSLSERELVIIGVDPGKETGVVLYRKNKLREKASLPAAEVTPWVLHRLDDYDPAYFRIIIAVERYNIGPHTVKKTRQLDALDLMSQLKLTACHRHVKFRTVNQADSKKLAGDRRLKDIGWFTIGHGHINDGARVALTTLAREDATVFADLVGL